MVHLDHGSVFLRRHGGFLPKATWLRLVLWSAIGIAIYLLYGYRNSRLREHALPAGDASAAAAKAR